MPSLNGCKINLLATDFFFQILAHPVFKMWVIQKPNTVALWNKRHFEEKKKRLYSMFKIFSTDICWINIKWDIQRVILRPSYVWDARFLKVKVHDTTKSVISGLQKEGWSRRCHTNERNNKQHRSVALSSGVYFTSRRRPPDSIAGRLCGICGGQTGIRAGFSPNS